MFSVSPGVKRQAIAAILCCLSAFISGCMVGWPAPTLKKLRQPDSHIRMTPYEEAWVVNALYFGNIISPFPSGYIMNKLGRKMSLISIAIFPLLSWILIYFSTSVRMLMAARLFSGFWVGGTHTMAPIYTAEISEPHVRGMFGSLAQLCGFMGDNFVFMVAPYVSVPTMAMIGCVLPILFVTAFSFCPESPYFYAMKKKSKAAAKSLTWLRKGAPIQEELELIQSSVDKELKNQEGCVQKMTNLVTVPANRKAFIMVEIMNIFQRLCGISCMKAFSSIILPARLGPLTSDHCTIIVGFVWMFSSLICTGFIDKAGRKPLLYFSSAGIAISMLWTGGWYYLDRETSIDVSAWSWLPLAGFIVYGITFPIGVGPMGKIYQGEMFPSNVKGQAAAITTMIVGVASSVSNFMFAVLTKHVGLYSNFLLFSAVGVATFLFTYFCVIETKGKSLQMIQKELQGENFDSKVSDEKSLEN